MEHHGRTIEDDFDQRAAFQLIRLVGIMRRLRDRRHGCPWDIEQDFATILPYTIEEAYEVADAIERQHWDDLEGELGDLLLQTVYHAQIGSEKDLFDIASIAKKIGDKMVLRHPHVFESAGSDMSAADQERNWEECKARERAANLDAGVLAGIARALPALTRAAKLQHRAAGVGFDWPDSTGVVHKVQEEVDELIDALDQRNASAIAEEFGDLLFSCVNLARHLKLDPEAALRAANDKFCRRFESMEADMRADGLSPDKIGLPELENYWARAKLAGAS